MVLLLYPVPEVRLDLREEGNACILRAMRRDRKPFSSGCINAQALGAAGDFRIIIHES